MDNEPRWLDIQDELYPQISIIKQIVFQNSHSGTLTEFFSEIKYNSFKRQIDLTPIVFKYFIQNDNQFNAPQQPNLPYQILIRDQIEQKIHFIGYFPQDDIYTLGQNFLSEEILHLIVRIQLQPQLSSQIQAQEQIEKTENIDNIPQAQLIGGQKPLLNQSQQSLEQNLKGKSNKRRTVQQVLKIIAEWRKLIIVKKIPSSEAADKVGMSKRSLQDYFTIIKLAEKYGFDFQSKMKKAFAELRNFVKENHETKPAPKVQILQKFKSTKK